MQSVLGLDISSSTIGWSIVEFDDKVVKLSDYGYIKPPNSKKGSLSFRLDEARKEIEGLIKTKKPDFVAVEDYAKKFTKGRSSANTIIILSVFNEMCCLAAYQLLEKDVYRYSVSTIRAALGKHFGVKVVSKDEIFPVIVKNSKSFTPKINRVGNIKKESGDEADSIAVALTFVLKEFDNGQRYNI